MLWRLMDRHLRRALVDTKSFDFGQKSWYFLFTLKAMGSCGLVGGSLNFLRQIGVLFANRGEGK